MNIQKELIHQVNTWMHFVGGYYSDTDKFADEARRQRISRRAPAQQVRGMQFGDQLVLLRYERPAVAAFAEAEIIGVTLDREISEVVGERLAAEGLAEFHEPAGGCQTIERECGSYTLLGFWTVTCSLPDVMDIAIQEAKAAGEKLFVMVNADLRKAYDQPVYLEPAPKFTRGFIKSVDDASFHFDEFVSRSVGARTRHYLPANGSQ